MSSIQEFTVTEVVARVKTVELVRARLDDHFVLIRRSAKEYPNKSDLAQLRYGAEIAASLDLPCVLRVAGTRRSGESFVVIHEDPGGMTLRSALDGGRLSVERALRVAIEIAMALGELHRRRIVHKDLQPSNVFLDGAGGAIKLAGFDIASRLDREMATPASPDRLEGTLAYISPEQTGRMNRAIDYRTDFYSLGVVLTEMLLGRPPFEAASALSLVHAHIAVEPPPLHEIDPSVPLPLSRVVARLLAKNAEDRYQSAYGLMEDLLACGAMYKEGASGEDFVPGTRDVSAVFRLTQKIHGRDAERAALIAAFTRASGGPLQMTLVGGYSGVGKSALVNELQRPVVERRGYFVSGKYDQLQNVPYGAIIQALEDLVRQILTESEASVASWKGRLEDALGASGQIVIDVIPDVERILGPQAAVPSAGPTETRSRFHLVFGQFISALASEAHPLVVFLDDLQWADTGSLDLIQKLVKSGAASHLLLIGAYRDNEVDAGHPLGRWLAELRKGADDFLQEMALGPITLDDVTALIADAFSRKPDADLWRLAQLVFRKTDGNPFFTNQLLSFLHARDLLSFDHASGRWVFDVDAIEAVGVSADVAGLVAERLKGLSSGAKEVLRLAACIGNTFDLHTLSVVNAASVHDTAAHVWSAVERELVRPSTLAYRYVDLSESIAQTLPPQSVLFEFLHDRVQEAALASLSVEDKRGIHLRVGRLLLASTSPEEREARCFDIVNQLDLAASLVTDPEERRELSRLNLSAGTRAKSSTAYVPAERYLSMGVDLLPEDAFRSDYELAFALYRHWAEAKYLLGDHDGAWALLERLLREARSLAEKTDVHLLKSSLLANVGKYRDSAVEAMAGLHLYGVDLPIGEETLKAGLAAREKLEGMLAGRVIEDLADLPGTTDEDEKARQKLLSQALIYGAYNDPILFQLLACTLVIRSIEHGHALGSASGYLSYGVMVSDYGKRYALGRVTMAVSERFDDVHFRSLMQFTFGAFLNNWRKPISEGLPYIEQAYLGCVELGIQTYAALSAMQTTWLRLLRGDDLAELRAHARRSRAIQGRTNQLDFVYLIGVFERTAVLLSEGSIPPEEAAYLDDVTIAENLAHWGIGKLALDINSMMVAYLLGDLERARLMEARSVPMIGAAFGHIGGEPELRFYQALLFAALFSSAPSAEKEDHRKAVGAAVEQMATWAASCPENFEPKYLVAKAEFARIEGRHDEASDLYDRAIDAAVEYEVLYVQGIACEHAGRFHLEKGRRRVAQAYLRDARHAFARWGADAKVAEIDRRYAELFPQGAAGEVERTAGGAELDLKAVMAASQAISSEIVQGDLLLTLMRTVVESAGAQRGFLVLSSDDPMYVEAHYDPNTSGLTISVRAEALSMRSDVAHAIVRHVERTRESVVLADATRALQFQADPYIAAERPRSVLCTPVLKQKKLVGVLYLENNLVTSAFTRARCAVLDMLSAQAAISIENARLYDTLEQLVEARTRELSVKNHDLQKALQHLKVTQRQLVTQEKLASLGALTSGIAHELKNPLHFIKNFAEYSSEIADDLTEVVAKNGARIDPSVSSAIGAIADELRENLQTINNHGSRANGIINGMLLHARGTSGQREFSAVNELCAESVDLACHGTRADGFPLRIEAEYDQSLGAIEMNSPEVRRVLINIVSNALHAMRARQRAAGPTYTPTLLVRTRDCGDHVEITVRDNGTGIPDDVVAKMWNPFFTTKPAGEGTGLGLSISRDIVVDGHQGDIRVETALGEFTALIVTLPKRAASA